MAYVLFKVQIEEAMGFWYGIGAAGVLDARTTTDHTGRKAQKQVGIKPSTLGREPRTTCLADGAQARRQTYSTMSWTSETRAS
jgi:hypothetical protein